MQLKYGKFSFHHNNPNNHNPHNNLQPSLPALLK
jgi:hypothetical protein